MSISIDVRTSKFTILGEKPLWITAIVTVTVEVHIYNVRMHNLRIFGKFRRQRTQAMLFCVFIDFIDCEFHTSSAQQLSNNIFKE